MKFSLIQTFSILVLASTAMASPLARYKRTGPPAVNATSISVNATSSSVNGTSSKPPPPSGPKPPQGNSGVVSFDNWKNIQSLRGFDGFFGSDNFDGRRNQQVVIVEQQQVCSRREAVVIQQQLSIVMEFAKRLLLEQICDVETQIVILEQFRGRMRQFKSDLRHQSGRNVSFDSNISQLISQLVNSDGSLNSHDFGFNGRDIGQHSRIIGGSNWNDGVSPQNINDILSAIASSGIAGPHSAHKQ